MSNSKYLFLLTLFSFTWTVSTHAQEHVLTGAIDSKHAVHMFLQIKGDKVEVSYFYDRYGMPIYLEGSAVAGKIAVENSSEKFAGIYDGNVYSGTWTDKRRKYDLPFALKPAETSFSAMSGRYKCTATRSGAGGGATVPLLLEMKAGQVSRFEIESVVMPQAHTCNPDYTKFRQSLTRNVLLVEGTVDADQRCPISLRRAGPFVLLKNEGGACLCGARASVPDLLLDTRNSSCRIAQ